MIVYKKKTSSNNATLVKLPPFHTSCVVRAQISLHQPWQTLLVKLEGSVNTQHRNLTVDQQQ